MKIAADFFNEMKRNESRGRCLHFERGERCNEIISAHSIQKSNQLGEIAEAGHVYRITAEMSVLRDNNWQPAPQKIGWKKASTFSGFCKYHDNELFKPIDNYPLEPNSEQVALYAYRCMCREYFTKENVATSLKNFINNSALHAEQKNFLEASYMGHSLGFQRLQYHKKYFDAALLSKSYSEFQFLTLTSNSPWHLQLSGVLYPDFDFLGGGLQDLGDFKSPLDFITFFTAPLAQGWSFTLCWHASSNNSCVALARSLASAVSCGASPQDALLRFSFSCCENHAFRITWWDSLPVLAREAILSRVALMADPEAPVPSDYLAKGLEGIAGWEVENIFTTLTATS
ncbi:hypothetical protein [Aquipseudomonas ullengensis]|uniref:Uncharacterized protein n=1 Tax=Aquipseudomonas ullengensis TaxID=2759166 RepID=A0A7W4LQJ6_9GAMM|nr:hypothetical protein [Pseudomonas ullengensis]MBB2497488.1 hypothetical protein [Pseudomonas ullengensis]